MTNDWQTWTALGVVAITAVFYVRYLVRRKSKRGSGGSCDSDCGCEKGEQSIAPSGVDRSIRETPKN